jgi:putative membrane protein
MAGILLASLAALHGGEASFSWTEFDIYPSVLIGDLLLAVGYLWAVGPLRRKYGWAERVSGWRVASFLTAIAVMFVSLTGPLDELGDTYLFSAHMVQHLLLMMVMAPLMIMGLPDWLIRAALRVRGVRPAARVLTHPAVAFVVYNVVLIGWHFPGPYNYALAHENVHILEHLMFMAVAVMMWWPVVNPVPELDRLRNDLVRLLYVFAYGIPMSMLSAFISLSSSPAYVWYVKAPRIFGISALQDQALGGLIMWIPGMIIYWIAMTVLFLRYSSREDKEEPASLQPPPSGRGPEPVPAGTSGLRPGPATAPAS